MDNMRPISPFPDTRLDSNIVPLIEAMNRPKLITLGSCQGHDNEGYCEEAYVDFAVQGLEGLRELVNILNMGKEILERYDIVVDLTVNWDEETATACDFLNSPDWIMLSMRMMTSDGDIPTGKQLEIVAHIFRPS